MTDAMTFEVQLQHAFDRYLEAAPTAVDAVGMARATVAARVRPGPDVRGWRLDNRRGLLLVATATLVLVLIAIGAALVGGWRPLSFLHVTGHVLADGPSLADEAGAVGLRDGRVFALVQPGGSAEASAKVLDANATAWTDVGHVPMAGLLGAPVLLADGRVFFLGDPGGTFGDESSGFLFDPATNGIQPVGPTALPLTSPMVTALRDGRVLIVPGYDDKQTGLNPDRAEVFDPRSAQFEAIATFPVRDAPIDIRPVTLADGRVLFVPANGTRTLAIFDATSAGFTTVDLQVDREAFPGAAGAGLLPDGRVLLFGQQTNEGKPAQAFTWTEGETTLRPYQVTPTGFWVDPFGDGQYLIFNEAPDAAVIWDPEGGDPEPIGPFAASYPNVVPIPDGRILLVGGYQHAPVGPSGTPPGSAAVQVIKPAALPRPTPEASLSPSPSPVAGASGWEQLYLRPDLTSSKVDVVVAGTDAQGRHIQRFIRRIDRAVAGLSSPLDAIGRVSEKGWLAVDTQSGTSSTSGYALFNLGDPSAPAVVIPPADVLTTEWSPNGQFAVARGNEGGRAVDVTDPRTGSSTSLGLVSLFGGGPSIVWARDGSAILNGSMLKPADGGPDVEIGPDRLFADRRVGTGGRTIEYCTGFADFAGGGNAPGCVVGERGYEVLDPSNNRIGWYPITDPAQAGAGEPLFSADGRSFLIMLDRVDAGRHFVSIQRVDESGQETELAKTELPAGARDPNFSADPTDTEFGLGYTLFPGIDPIFGQGLVLHRDGSLTVALPYRFAGYVSAEIADSWPALDDFEPGVSGLIGTYASDSHPGQLLIVGANSMTIRDQATGATVRQDGYGGGNGLIEVTSSGVPSGCSTTQPTSYYYREFPSGMGFGLGSAQVGGDPCTARAAAYAGGWTLVSRP
jgi:hypothetical protein